MIKVGITGGIGSGKTIICGIFSRLGIPVFDADTEAKKLYNSDADIRGKMLELFGKDIYLGNEIDRKKLAGIIFNDKNALIALNSLLHPLVKRNFNFWLDRQSNVAYVIKEAALLFESGSYEDLNLLILVSAPEEVRLRRVLQRDGTNKEAVLRIMKNQLTDEEKKEKSQFVILNDDLHPVLPQVLRIDSLIRCKHETG